MNFNSFFQQASKLKTEKNPSLSADEVSEYSKLFVRLAGKNPSLSYEKMVDFMRHSFLRNEFLTEVLLIGLKNPLEQIGQRQFNCLMKLIACKQAGHKISQALLYDQKVPRGLVRLGEEAVFQLTRDEITEYESQSFFCKNKSEIANFTKASMDTLNQVVQLVGFNKKEEMFSTEETIVILHLIKKAQFYNIPKILPAHLAKYIKTEHHPSVLPSTPTAATNSSFPAASFLQIGQFSSTPSTANLSRTSMPTQPAALSNKDLLGQPTLPINRTGSQTAALPVSSTAALFGFTPSQVQPTKQLPKTAIEVPSTPVVPATQSFNLLDGIASTNSTPPQHPSPPVQPNQVQPAPSIQPAIQPPTAHPPQPSSQQQQLSPPGSLPALPPTPTNAAPPNYSNPFADIESPQISQPQPQPKPQPQPTAIPTQVEAPQHLSPDVKFSDIEPLGAKVEQLERQKKNLQIEIIKIQGESDMAVSQLKESNAKLRGLLVDTLQMNRQLLKEREETNSLIKSLVEGNQISVKQLEAARLEFQTVAATGKIERDKLLTQVRTNQQGLVLLVRQKYDELKQFTNSTNRQLAELAKTIDDSKLAIGVEFGSQGPSQQLMVQPHEIKTDLQHDDQENSWKVFETNMQQQQQQPSTGQWPPLEL